MKKSFLLFVLLCLMMVGFSQKSYFVFFKDKSGSLFNPVAYFDAKALERKIIFGIEISDSTDYPVSTEYLSEIQKSVTKTGYESRWFNGVYVWATEEEMSIVNSFPFVKKSILITTTTVCSSISTAAQSETENLAIKQLLRMQGESFNRNGINGKGVRVAVFDAGFPEVNTHRAFDHIRKDNRILKTYDFTKKSEFVYSYNSHGLSTLSNIAGIFDSIQLGLATGAEFLLARTEINTEPFAEEQYWMAAAEWADKNGAHIISSSLGYTSDRYFPEQMDGKHSLVVNAANMAATKGMLVINAMGNDGNSKWKALGTPADADSIISVGGIDPETNYHINFSSFGPTKDGRLKPNVCAFGKATVASTGDDIETAFGTSFATPLIAGFAACAWQTMMTKNNMEMKTEIEHSGDLYPYYDYAHGYGVPQASYFTEKTPKEKQIAPYSISIKENKVQVTYLLPLDSVQIRQGKFYEDDKTDTHDSKYYLYFHIAKPDGTLARYGVVEVYSELPISFELNEIPKGFTLRIAYKNGFQEWTNTK